MGSKSNKIGSFKDFLIEQKKKKVFETNVSVEAGTHL